MTARQGRASPPRRFRTRWRSGGRGRTGTPGRRCRTGHRAARDDRVHRAREVERKVALGRRLTEEHLDERRLLDAVVGDDRRCRRDERSEHGGRSRYDVDHRRHGSADARASRASSSGGNSSDPPWKLSAMPRDRWLPRRLESDDRDVGVCGIVDHRCVRAERVARDALDVHLDPARQRKRRRADGRGLVGEQRDARCCARTPASGNAASAQHDRRRGPRRRTG